MQTPKPEIDKKVFALIAACLKRIKIPSLAELAKKSLLKFYAAQYNELNRSLSAKIALYAAIMLLAGKSPVGESIKPTQVQISQAKQTVIISPYVSDEIKVAVERTPPRLLGVPMQKYSEEYAKDNVRPVVDRLAVQYPQDPNDSAIKHRNSLRNLAEMEVRWQGHVDEIEEFKSRGVKLAIVSAHADCSKRCSDAQGKVVSLDGSSGTTPDGRHYEPLEKYTDIFVTTKAGKTYKNGLFGFNCRHYLVEYKDGYEFPKPNAKQERMEYAITERQRQLEEQVRRWRTKAIESKGVDPKEYKRAKAKALYWNDRYIKFSLNNNRAFYPSRTKIL